MESWSLPSHFLELRGRGSEVRLHTSLMCTFSFFAADGSQDHTWFILLLITVRMKVVPCLGQLTKAAPTCPRLTAFYPFPDGTYLRPEVCSVLFVKPGGQWLSLGKSMGRSWHSRLCLDRRSLCMGLCGWSLTAVHSFCCQLLLPSILPSLA